MKDRFDLKPLKAALRQSERVPTILFGIALAGISSVLLFPVLVWFGDLSWNIRAAEFYTVRIPKVIVGALIVAFIEECFFRGLLLQNLLIRHRPAIAISVISLFYAAVHFIAPVKAWQFPGYSVAIGFSYLGTLFNQAFTMELLSPFIGLFLVGVTLGLTMYRRQNIYLCIGLHSGWICVVKSVLYLTEIDPERTAVLSSLAKRYFLVSHPVAWISVVMVAGIIWLGGSARNKKRQ